MERKFTGRGKLLLFGEHCAVYGYPACGIPLECTVSLSVHGGGAEITLCGGLERYEEAVAGFFSYIRKNFSMYSDLLDRKFYIDTDIPVSSGLGSSAALCTAAAEYFVQEGGPYGEYSGKPENVWCLANELEKYFHGTPSGIDTGLSCSDTAGSFVFGGGALPEREVLPWPDFNVIYGAVPRKGSTKELVSGIRKAYKENPEYITGIMGRLGNCSSKFTNLLSDANSGQFMKAGRLALEAHELLSELHLSTDIVNRIIRTATGLGSSGGKMSGAGGGGAFWLAADNHESALRICSDIKKEFGIDLNIADRITNY